MRTHHPSGTRWRRAAAATICVLGGLMLVASCTTSAPAPEVPRPLDVEPTYAHPPTPERPAGPMLYVAPDGDDAGSGSRDDPFATIEKADSVAGPGTTVLVADGTYRGAILTRASGTPDARITYVAQNKWGAQIVADKEEAARVDVFGDEGAVWHNFGDYVDIRGFDITGTATDGLIDTGSYVRLVENRVHELTESCISTWSENYDLHDVDIIGNVVSSCGRSELDHGIYPSHVRGTISNNISYDNRGYGIHCWHNCNDLVISNNLVFENDEGGILIGQGDNPNFGDVDADHMLVVNNIAIDNGRYGIRESGATGNGNRYLNNNVHDNEDGGLQLQTGTEIGTIVADPVFVQFEPDGTGDYRLQSRSPNVDAGTDVGAPGLDLDGTVRPQGAGVDVGVYER
jgi:hypothetical protein